MVPCYYTFEAKEIQRFILQSDKLRDMVGGSELVNRLCTSLLDDALRAVGVRKPEDAVIAAAAGWARVRLENERQAEELLAIWPLVVDRFAPGLQVIQAMVPIDKDLSTAMEKGFEILHAERNSPRPAMPEAGPLVSRNPRTGAPASEIVKERDNLVPVDRGTARKRNAMKSQGTLVDKILEFKGAGDKEFAGIGRDSWPYEIEEIASDESAYVAVIHADGNDLGNTVRSLRDHLKADPSRQATLYREFSNAIDQVTRMAVYDACVETVFKDFTTCLNGDSEKKIKPDPKAKVAARPIVLGGDDVTIIVRADLAIPFTKAFLQAFETRSEAALATLKVDGLPRKLTACAGIAFVKSSYPFTSAYHLCESLCGAAKKGSKTEKKDGRAAFVPSSLVFHRVTASMTEGWKEVCATELTGRAKAGVDPVKFWFGPYAVGVETGGMATLEKLEKLCEAIEKLPTGPIRTLVDTLHSDPVTAKADFRRLIQVADEKKGTAVADEKKGTAFKDALRALTGVAGDEIPLMKDNHTPLLDAHVLRVVGKGGRG